MIRRSDGKILDEVYNATRIRKKYFYKNKCIYTETDFDKISNYTFTNYNNNDSVKCPNCGNEGYIGDFYEGCPYCRTDFNIDYNYKRYDIIFLPISDNLFIILFLFIFFILPQIIIILIFLSIILKNLLYLFFVVLLVILVIIIIKKMPRNIKEDKSKIISCLNYELNHYYYSNDKYKDLIDFHIKKYKKINNRIIDGYSYIEIEYIINKYYFIKKEIIKKVDTEIALMKSNKGLNHKKGKANIQECANCGAPIDITKVKCEYCNIIIPKNIEWSLTKLQVFDKYNK